MSDDHDLQKVIRDAIAGMPASIQSALSNPKTSAIDRLKWVGLAIKIFQGAGGQPVTDSDVENKREVAKILKTAVPALEDPRPASV